VAARHRQRDVLDFVRGATGSFTEQHREQGRSAGMRYVDKAHVGLRVLAVGDDAVILDAAYQILHNGMIDAHHREAIERHVLDKGAKRILNGIEGLEVIQMFWIDIGDDGDIGGKLQKTAVRLVCFDHHPIAEAKPRIGAISVDDAAIDHRRVKAAGFE
jgi:hypothetical protein